MKAKLARLVESTRAGGSPAEPGLVRDCKILGFDSTRGRRYTEDAQRDAAPLYEGAGVFLDHPEELPDGTIRKGPRSVRDKFGWFENVRYVEGEGLRGDFRYNPKHAFARTFEGWLESNPGQIGFSHNALTDTSKNTKDPDGTVVITNIAEVASVDLVSKGATTQGLFESHMEPDITPETPAATPSEGGGSYADHCADMVRAICTDGSLDKAAKRKKIMKALDLMEEEEKAAPVEEAEEEEEEGEEKKVMEGEEEDSKECVEAARLASKDPKLKPLLEAYDRRKTRDRLRLLEGRCRDMCVDAKLPLASITDVFVSTLLEARDDRSRLALIEDRKTLGLARRPQSHGPAGRDRKKMTADDILQGITD